MIFRNSKNLDCKHNNKCFLCPFINNDNTDFNESKHSVFVKKGQYIYLAGSRPQGVYCIYDGKIKIVKSGSEGKEQIIQLAKNGDLIGLNGFFIDQEYSDCAVALEDSQLCHISKNSFNSLLDNHMELNKIMRKYLCEIKESMEDKILYLSQKTVRERLALNILYLNEYFGVPNNEKLIIDLPLSREDMANLVGTATETVIRILSDFKKEGILCFSGKKITIINLPSLKKAAEVYQ